MSEQTILKLRSRMCVRAYPQVWKNVNEAARRARALPTGGKNSHAYGVARSDWFRCLQVIVATAPVDAQRERTVAKISDQFLALCRWFERYSYFFCAITLLHSRTK